jgi:hypothetical protein
MLPLVALLLPVLLASQVAQSRQWGMVQQLAVATGPVQVLPTTTISSSSSSSTRPTSSRLAKQLGQLKQQHQEVCQLLGPGAQMPQHQRHQVSLQRVPLVTTAPASLTMAARRRPLLLQVELQLLQQMVSRLTQLLLWVAAQLHQHLLLTHHHQQQQTRWREVQSNSSSSSSSSQGCLQKSCTRLQTRAALQQQLQLGWVMLRRHTQTPQQQQQRV